MRPVALAAGHLLRWIDAHCMGWMVEKADLNRALRNLWLSLVWFGRKLVSQFLEHDCPARAGALTYTTLFAVVPMMTVAYAMMSIQPAYEGVSGRIEAFVFENFVPTSSTIVQDYLGQFAERARGLSVAGFGFLFVTTFLLLVTIESTFNTIWEVAEPRRGLQRFLVYWSVMSLGPSMIVGAILISLYLTSLPLLTDLDVAFGLSNVLLGYMPLVLTSLGFTVLYFAMPNTRVPFLHALLGGVLTMAGVEVAKEAFNLVVARSSFSSIYGAFAALPFFLFWMYMVWVLILSGAIFVRTLALKPEIETEPAEPLLVKCARVLQVLYSAHLRGAGVSDADIDEQVPLLSGERERILKALLELKLLRQAGDAWILGRSLKRLTLWDLYQALPEGLTLGRLEQVRGMEHVTGPLKALVQFGSNQMAVSLDTVFGGIE
jgi:membrane protein